MKRYFLLIKRISAARQLGFWFFGTSHTMLPDQLRLFDKKVVLKYPDDPTLISDVIDILLDDDYGLGKLASPVNTVVDIGANIGLFSLWARHHFPRAIIHAYEPNDAIWDFTTGNLKEAGVMLFNEGVSGEGGRAGIILNRSSRLAATEKDPQGSVKLTGIETVIERLGGKVDLLKMDCEGAEWDVFLRRDAFRTVRQIRMEYHLDVRHNMAVFETIISELGFRITRLIPNRDFGIAWLDNVRIK